MLETSRIVRRITRQVRVGSVRVGGDAPIVVQSMTNTDTTDSVATAEQVIQLAEAGRNVVQRFTWEKNVRQFELILKGEE